MSRLFLSCALCGRKQAAGLLSHARWASLDVGPGSAHRVCPLCQEETPDWEQRVRAVLADELGLGDEPARRPSGAVQP